MTVLRDLASVRRALRGGSYTADDLLALAAESNRELDEGSEPVGAFLSTVFDSGEASSRGPPEGGGTVRVEDEATGLEGAPVAVKDNICTLDLPTTCASRILGGYRSPYAATAVRRLEGAGARILGKTNLDEFAMGSSTENSAFHATRNPVDRNRVPGGSSGGSAAAVAASVVPVALGSSTGGSVRQPAAHCGIVGLKPTYGRVSRYGLVAFASSLDCIGVLSRTVRDGATVLETIAGRDPRDATCQDRPVPRAAALSEARLEGAVLGVPEEYLGEGLDTRVRELVLAALERAEAAGAEVRRVSLPSTRHAIPAYYVVAPAEASSNLSRYDGVRYGRRAAGADGFDAMGARSRAEGFGQEVKRRIMVGTYVLSAGYYEAYYLRALGLRRAIAEDFARVFGEGVDALFAPTAPTPAFRLGAKTSDPYEMYLADVYTVSANLAGIPAVSLPVGNADGLPVGGQLMCRAWDEERMLGLAHRLEEVLEYRHPLEEERAR